MTRWIFNGKHVDDYIDPHPRGFKYGTFMFIEEFNHTGWYRCSPSGPAPKTPFWKPVDEWDVPKAIRAKALLLL